jgi:hypothetical protein
MSAVVTREALATKGLEAYGVFYGLYKRMVVSIEDKSQGIIKVGIWDVYDEPVICKPLANQYDNIISCPAVGDYVGVMFNGGDTDSTPLYVNWFKGNSTAAYDLTQETIFKKGNTELRISENEYTNNEVIIRGRKTIETLDVIINAIEVQIDIEKSLMLNQIAIANQLAVLVASFLPTATKINADYTSKISESGINLTKLKSHREKLNTLLFQKIQINE